MLVSKNNPVIAWWSGGARSAVTCKLCIDMFYQAFGYDNGETGRAADMKKSNPYLRPIFPLLMFWLNKFECIKFIQNANSLFVKITVPITYRMGLENNNCFKTGCVQGGIGYWQWMQVHQPDKFDAMAIREHEITELKGEPCTICKDQSKGGGVGFSQTQSEIP